MNRITGIKALNAIIVFLLAIAMVNAVTVSYETSSVSRIVGNSPDDLINQLDAVEQELNHASYYGDEPLIEFDSFDTKRKSIEHMFNSYTIDDNWNYDEINPSSFQQQELLIIEAEGSPDLTSTETNYFNTNIEPRDTRDWLDDFARTYPVFVFDSDYAGLHIPKQNSYINELTRYSQIIAPTLFHSREFTTAFVCNLGDGKTLGNSFREARNKYYENTNPSNKELIGITLMSYHLYGNPLATIQTPNYDRNEMKKICGELLGEKEENPFAQQSFQSQALDNQISQIVVNNYNIINSNGFDIINASNGNNNFYNYELVKPYILKSHEFPKNTIITNITYEFNNPEIINLNLPEYQNGLVNRSCYFETENQTFEYEVQYTEDKQNLKFYINPLRVNNCMSGEFTYYKSITYHVDYISKSPIHFDIIAPDKILPKEDFNLSVLLNYVNTDVLNGEIELLEDNKTIYQLEVTNNVQTLNIPLIGKDEETVTKYVLRYVENETLTETIFEIETRLLEYALDIPEIIKGQADINLIVINNGNQPVTFIAHDNLIKDNNILQQSENILVANPGFNTYSYSYTNLLQSDQRYKLLFDLAYDYHGSLVDEIVTNHAPTINPIPTQEVRAGDLYTLNYSYYDLDGDQITLTISQPLGNDATWQTTPSDEGEYIINLTANDGFITIIKSFKLIVNPYNREPILDQLPNRTVYTNETVSIYLYAYDEDEDNLTYSTNNPNFIQVSDAWFEWYTIESDIGNHTIQYSVDDGRSNVTKTFNLEIIEQSTQIIIIDDDNDGYNSSVDCNDDNFSINPGAIEFCNGVDDDCDGIIDDDCMESIWCYQETANVSTSCGGLNNGSYNIEYNTDSFLNSSGKFYINYLKPDNVLSTSLFVAKIANQSITNFTIPNACWNANSDKLSFMIESFEGFNTNHQVSIYCYGNNNWLEFFNIISNLNNGGALLTNSTRLLIDGDWDTHACFTYHDYITGFVTACHGSNLFKAIYEEAMWWNIAKIDDDSDADGYNSSVDCNDDNFSINPGAIEFCNGVDDDCDGIIDDNCRDICFESDEGINIFTKGALNYSETNAEDYCNGNYLNEYYCINEENTWGFGIDFVLCSLGCVDGACIGNYSMDLDEDGYNFSIDCDDTDQDKFIELDVYADWDGDTFIQDDSFNLHTLCTNGSAPEGFTLEHNDIDCYDRDETIYFNATESCDGKDNDCDGTIDEGCDRPGDWCYQETANVSEQCGAVDTGSYDFKKDTGSSSLYINYTKPFEALSTSLYKVRVGSKPTSEVNIPSACWSFQEDKISFKITYQDNNSVDVYCLYGFGWQKFFYDTVLNDFGCSGSFGGSGVIDNFNRLYDGDWSTGAHYCLGTIYDFYNILYEDEPRYSVVSNVFEEAMIWNFISVIDNDGDGFNSSVDCNDDNFSINPGAVEVCNGVDDNCDGFIDEENVCQNNECLDSDGGVNYFEKGITTQNDVISIDICTSQSVLKEYFCTWDLEPNGRLEILSNIENCEFGCFDGACIGNSIDLDGDGYNSSVDCDDNNASKFVWMGFSKDLDGDQFIDSGQGFIHCGDGSIPPGYTNESLGDDCYDKDSGINPNAPELCDGVDNNCEGFIDEGCDRLGDWCYQETANVATGCGGLDTGSYDLTFNPGPSQTGYSTFFVNYSKPTNSESTSLYKVRIGDKPIYELNIPNSCWNYQNDKISYKIEMIDNGSNYVDLYCLDNSGWYKFFEDSEHYLENLNGGTFGGSVFITNNDLSYLIDGDWNTMGCYINDYTFLFDFCVGEFEYSRIFEEAMIWNSNVPFDNDGDNYDNTIDCDDNNASIFRNMTLYVDNDGDSFSYINTNGAVYCIGNTIPNGYTDNAMPKDCYDGDNIIYPGALELCDGVDNNCDGTIDENCDRPGVWCIQETADELSDCSGPTLGSYSYRFEPENSKRTEIYINYTKPVGAKPTSLYKVKIGTKPIYELSIPLVCWNEFPDKISFMIKMFDNPINSVSVYCDDGGIWKRLLEDVENIDFGGTGPGGPGLLPSIESLIALAYDGNWDTNVCYYNPTHDLFNVCNWALEFSSVYEEAMIWNFISNQVEIISIETLINNNNPLINWSNDPYPMENIPILLKFKNIGDTSISFDDMMNNIPVFNIQDYIVSYQPNYIPGSGYWDSSLGQDFNSGEEVQVGVVGYFETSGSKQLSVDLFGINNQVIINVLENPDCYDSDGGNNSKVPGWVIGTVACVNQEDCIFSSRVADSCRGNELREQICSEDSLGILRRYYVPITCVNGCENGMCI